MQQLKMKWVRSQPPILQIPSDLSVRAFDSSSIRTEAERWLTIAKQGLLGADAGYEIFEQHMLHYPDLRLEDILFVEKDGEAIATVATVMHGASEGYVHMVACIESMRGRGIGTLLNRLAITSLYERGASNAYLTTDDFRLAAIKSYLSIGFRPVLSAKAAEQDREEMLGRWRAVLEKLNIIYDENTYIGSDSDYFENVVKFVLE